MKRRVKKYMNRAVLAAGILLVLIMCSDVTLRVVSSRPWVRNYVAEQVSKATGRQVELSGLSVSLFSVRVRGFKMAEAGGFENGVFVEVKRLSAGFSLLHLLHKHIVIRNVSVRGITVNVIKNEDGRLNIEDLSSAPVQNELPPDPEKPFGWRLSWKRLFVDKTNFIYQDKTANLDVRLSRFFLEGKTISLRRDFNFESNWQVDYSAPDTPPVCVVGGVAGVANLGGLEWSKAFLRLKGLVLRYADTPLTLSGTVNNFVNPEVDFSLLAEDFSQRTLADFLPGLPEFSVPQISLRAKGSADTDKKSVTLNYFSFNMPGVEASALGGVLYGDKPDYDLQAAATVNLAELAENSVWLKSNYQPLGRVEMTSSAVPDKLSATVTLTDVGAHVQDVGTFKEVNAVIKAIDANDIQVINLKGRLNDKAFSGSASYLDKKQYRNVGAWLKLDGLTILTEEESRELSGEDADPLPSKDVPSEKAPAAAAKPAAAEAFVPVNVKLSVASGPVQTRYFYTNTLDVDVTLSGVTPDLHAAHGTVNVNFSKGNIRDIYKLTDANAMTKIVFMSLNVVSRVINSLNLWDLVASLSSDAASGDKRPKTAGEMPFDSFTGAMDFQHGNMTMKQGSFVSDMMSLKIAGTTDFTSGKVNMQVNAAPGKHYEDGIMPITISVGGTVDDPKGSVSMLSSAAALVTQPVTNNFASNAVKKGVGGLLGLFKKKKQPAEAEQQPDEFVPLDPAVLEALAAEKAAAPDEYTPDESGQEVPAK